MTGTTVLSTRYSGPVISVTRISVAFDINGAGWLEDTIADYTESCISIHKRKSEIFFSQIQLPTTHSFASQGQQKSPL
jgi:hypothetical protein